MAILVEFEYHSYMIANSEKLIGKKVARIATRESWMDGEIISPCVDIFIEESSQVCWRLYYDDENWVWCLVAYKAGFPKIDSGIGDKNLGWPVVVPDGCKNFIGQEITAIEESEADGSLRVRVELDKIGAIEATINLQTNKEELKFTVE